MKRVLVNPNISDYFFPSFKSLLFKRKPLLKYSNNFDYYVCNESVFSSKLNFLISIEIFLWNQIIGKKYGVTLINLKDFKILEKKEFYFSLPAVNDYTIKYIKEKYINSTIKIYYSHAHVHFDKIKSIIKHNDLIFLTENNIVNSLIIQKLMPLDIKYDLIKFNLNKRVLNAAKKITDLNSKGEGIIITGTYHDSEKNYIFKKQTTVFNVRTLHPMRYYISENKSLFPTLKILTDNLIQKNYLELLFSSSQKKYFTVDIISRYLSSRFSIIDIENITGIVPINYYESVVLGLIPIVPSNFIQYIDISGYEKSHIYYSDEDALKKVCENSDAELLKNIDIENFKKYRSFLTNKYSK